MRGVDRRTAIRGLVSLALVVFMVSAEGTPTPTPTPTGGPADLPVINVGAGGAVLDGKLYVAGGHDEVWRVDTLYAYDPVLDQWEQKAFLPSVTGYPDVVALNGKLYSVGGAESDPSIQIYDPGTDSWSLGANMPNNRFGVAATVLDGKIHAIGGDPWTGWPQTSHNVYDPVADSWTSKAGLPQAQRLSAAETYGGKIYVFGGSAVSRRAMAGEDCRGMAGGRGSS